MSVCRDNWKHQKVPKAGEATSLGLFVAQRRRVSIIAAVLLMLRSIGMISAQHKKTRCEGNTHKHRDIRIAYGRARQ